MEKYRVLYKKFKDLEDNNHIYKQGDIYPREGLEPSKKRIKELSSNKNKIGEILIEKIEDSKEEKEPTNDEKVENPEDNQEPIEDKETEDSKEEKEPTENEKTTK